MLVAAFVIGFILGAIVLGGLMWYAALYAIGRGLNW